MKNYKQLKKELLSGKGVKKAYNELGPEFAVIEAIMEKRLNISKSISLSSLSIWIIFSKPAVSHDWLTVSLMSSVK